MRHIALPEAPFDVSNLCLGTGRFGSAIDAGAAREMLDAFVEVGGDFIDTAHCYADWIPGGAGASERCIGDWIAERDAREQLIVGTKGGHPNRDSHGRPRLRPDEIAHDLTVSLERLRIDRIDLYWLHRDDPDIPVDEILDLLNGHLAAGRIRAIGASNWSIARLEAAGHCARRRGWTGFCASQIGWSLAVCASPEPSDPMDTRFMDDGAWQWHCRSRLPVTPFSPQARGFFAGKVRRGKPVSDDVIARRYDSPGNLDRLDRAGALAEDMGTTANGIALAWLFSQPFPVSAVIGPRNVDQLAESLAAADLRLSAEQARWLANGPARKAADRSG